MQFKKILHLRLNLNFHLIENIFPKRCMKYTSKPKFSRPIQSDRIPNEFFVSRKIIFSTLVKIQVRLIYNFSNS